MKSANNEEVNIRGHFKCTFIIEGHQGEGNCHVANTTSLLVLEWIIQVKPLFQRLTGNVTCNAVSALATLRKSLTSRLQKLFAAVFIPSLGCCTKSKVSFKLKPDAAPVLRNARSIPYGVQPRIAQEIDKVVAANVLTPVNHADCAAPCRCAEEEWIKPLMCLFSGTHRGLYRLERLYGVKSAPGVFQQQEVDTLVAGLKGTAVYLNDIIVTGTTIDEHTRSEALCRRIHDNGFRSSNQVGPPFTLQSQITDHNHASNHGIGAALPHRFLKGSEKPIYHASRTLTPAQKKYRQIGKEALAIIFAGQTFHRFIHVGHFTLKTDHKPLVSIFESKKRVPVYGVNRLQRWATLFLYYDFNIEYVRTSDFGHAEALSRLRVSHSLEPEDKVIAAIDADVIAEIQHNCDPISFKAIQTATAADRVLTKIVDAYSGLPEIIRMDSVFASSAIPSLTRIFAQFGNPQTLITDYGTQFT
ncbi:hypothetical protein TELCIR_04330 [Teladorsagia circumcincta]|uniref:Integrase catalytic domain-containing protein n=1 Tax=Teladorsagia circumcincta TaxID=45464 RepID=A0A2G9UTX7_TELCI|nr:hypothetical protein TELCIR_04330 [Teladorsagia circumcincta]